MTAPTDPLDYLRKLEVVATAVKKCPHCYGKSTVVRSQAPAGIGVYRFAVEHEHDRDCPEHEDQRKWPGDG